MEIELIMHHASLVGDHVIGVAFAKPSASSFSRLPTWDDIHRWVAGGATVTIRPPSEAESHEFNQTAAARHAQAPLTK